MLVLDQASKLWLLDVMEANGFRGIEVTGFFNLVMVWNRGVSFGLLNSPEMASVTRWLLVALALAISAGLAVWLRRLSGRLPVWGVGLVIGGAVGNAIDRVAYGAVVDFFDVHAFGWHWPAFNVADSVITVGVALLLVDALLAPKSGTKLGR